MISSQLARAFRDPWDERRICEAIQVSAMLGDSVIGVPHCVDPRGGKVSRATRAIAALGLVCLLASAIAFGVSVSAAASDAAGLARHTRVLKRPAYAFRPHRMSDLAGGVVFGGLALGLAALAAALLRAGSERERACYRIGTAPGVEQPLEGAPSESFPLVAPAGDGFVLNHGPGIEGELIAGGASTPLSELAAAGRARPSATVPGAFEIPIPPAAEIRARVGRVTFLVSAADRPEPRATPAIAAALDLRAMWYIAGSLAVHLAIVHALPRVAHEEDAIPGDITICFWPPFDPSTPPEPEEEEVCERPCICHSVARPRSREEEVERAIYVARTADILARTRPHDLDPPLASADLDRSAGLDDEGPWRPVPIPSPRSVEGGTLDKSVIKRRIKQHQPQISYCYHKELLVRPGLGGTVSVRFLIGPAGDVQRSSGAGFDETVASCVAKAIGRIAFPASRNGTPARVSYSFDFRP